MALPRGHGPLRFHRRLERQIQTSRRRVRGREVKRVLVGSGGWYAHLVAEDANHQTARRLFRQAHAERGSLFTTNAVVFEAHALILNRGREGHALALTLLEDLESGFTTIVRVTKRDEVAGESRLGRAERGAF